MFTNEKGRSMIEMLGVLGVMAVITVLALSAYKTAYRNSKMNDFKQDVAVIVQQIDSSYANQGFMDEGVILGEERTFENMFVSTDYLKSSISPFGGVYNISAVSNDLFELEVGPMQGSDCEYLVSDTSVLKKSESMALSCIDDNGVNYYSENNPNNPSYSGGDNNSDNSGGGLASKNLNQLSKKCRKGNVDACSALIEKDTNSKKLGSVCADTNNERVCTAFLTNENSKRSDIDDLCSLNPKRCGSIISENPEGVSVKAVMSSCIAGGYTVACGLLLSKDGVTNLQKKTACKDSSDMNLCGSLLSDNEIKVKDIKNICADQMDICNQIAVSDIATTKLTTQTCAVGGDRKVCSSLVLMDGVTKSQKLTACSGSGNYEVCSNLLVNGSELTKNQIGNVCGANIRNCYSALKGDDVSKNTAKKACNETNDSRICYVSCVKGTSSSCDKSSPK